MVTLRAMLKSNGCITSNVFIHILQYVRANSETVVFFLLYLEWSREVNFFCLLQTQSNEGDVGRFTVGKSQR